MHEEGKSATVVVDQLRQEFVDEAVETLQGLDVILDSGRHGHAAEDEVVDAFRRAAVRLRGPAGNFGMRALAVVCHRLDDYLTHAPAVLPPRVWDDLQRFIDLMLTLAEGEAGNSTEAASLVRSLPPRLGFELGDIQIRCVEVLLVMPHGAQTRYVERELQQCGYRVSVLDDTIEAFSQVVQSKPDLIVISALMPHLEGIDLAIGLAAMPSTRNIPIAVITSLDPDDERLSLLPKRIPVVHKGADFGDGLFKALDSLFLI
ncbi:Hpt domain-containing protein [Magnetospirillum aberrantis]|uniref:Response regulator n=1 Tax=Magnetospirillum aberrantis SpK TaxID=908842 RepID=A0A7C9QVS3_9PROT|nr:Hpt domain-containing protein [Magnetospirillum aberrantis]NFV80516.1 response regulator [Magnetospirillum aberrantis SpK]